MSFLHRSGDKRKSVDDYDYDDRHDELNMSPSSPKCGHPMENEKRLRREIANSNERRRMQSINAGFESLKTIIPHHREEKLSKAAILQQTSEYINNLETEKGRLLSQNTILRQTLKELNHNPDTLVGSLADQITLPPPPKRKKRDTESSDEGISLGFDEVQMDELKKEVIELRLQLDRERKLRQALEDRIQAQAPPAPAPAPATATVKAEPDNKPPVQQQQHSPPPPPPPAPAHTTPTLSEKSTPVVEPVQTKFDVGCVVAPMRPPFPPGSMPVAPRVPVFNSSMSKRNLDTIVEAIRHLEGEHIMCDHHHGPPCRRLSPPQAQPQPQPQQPSIPPPQPVVVAAAAVSPLHRRSEESSCSGDEELRDDGSPAPAVHHHHHHPLSAVRTGAAPTAPAIVPAPAVAPVPAPVPSRHPHWPLVMQATKSS